MGITGEEAKKQDGEEVKISKGPFNDRSKSQGMQSPMWKNKDKKHRSTISRENNKRKTEEKKGPDDWDVRHR